MRKQSTKKLVSLLLAVALLLTLIAQPVFAAGAEVIKLRLLETTDIHVNLYNYDYYKDVETNEFGLIKTAKLIKQAREEVKNSLLFDNGDLLQGNPMGDYFAKVNPIKDGDVHPVYKVMNLMGYDAAVLGNHEFNYGLDFLNTALKGAQFPYLSANVFLEDNDGNAGNNKHYVKPYVILDKTVIDESGSTHTLKVGVIGFTPAQIMLWDKANLEGKLTVSSIVEAAKKYIPMVKAEGADIVIAVAHTGIDAKTPVENVEDAGYYLSQVEGIDAIMLGHAHKKFPGEKIYDGIEGIDNVKGTLNGVPAVMPGNWGNNLGMIDLTITKVDGKYDVTASEVTLRPIYDSVNKAPLTDADAELMGVAKADHEATLEFIRGEVAQTAAPIHSFFALVQDDPSIQIVTNAQIWYVQKALKGTEYEGLPILSAGAPFKCGYGTPSYYTNIPKGTVAIKNVSDLYIYPNYVYAVKLTGAEIIEWLEWSAGQFNQIDPSKTDEQALINTSFPTYNFDVIDGITYEVDVTQPAKYDGKCNIINEAANRIKNVKFNGKAIDPNQEFVVATNNYRASFTKVANPDGKRIILAAPDENRQAVIDYMSTLKTINPSADNNWKFSKINAPVTITFETSPDAKTYSEGSNTLKYVTTLENGYAKYNLNLAPAPAVTEYIVVKGDCLWKIAFRFGIKTLELGNFNKLKNMDLIYPGQKLLIPAK